MSKVGNSSVLPFFSGCCSIGMSFEGLSHEDPKVLTFKF